MNNKIYIAGQVSGIKYETAKKNFSKAERYWSRKGYEVVNPTKLCNKEWAGGVVWQFACGTCLSASTHTLCLTMFTARVQE